jgi:hypothetical protein
VNTKFKKVFGIPNFYRQGLGMGYYQLTHGILFIENEE